jgi:hypothetical protein
MSLRQGTLVMRIQSGWLFSTHHKKSFDFRCCCEFLRFSIMDWYVLFSLILSVCFWTDYRNCPFEFHTRPVLFSDGLLELSVWVSYSSLVLTVSGLKTFSCKSFRLAERFFWVSRTWSSFGLFRTVFQSETLIRGMSWVLSVYGTVKWCGNVDFCVALLHLTHIGFCPCLFSLQ